MSSMGGVIAPGERVMTSTGQRIDGDEPARPMTSVSGTGYVSKAKQDVLDNPFTSMMPGK